MNEIRYIDEQPMRDLIIHLGEQAKAEGKQFIKNPAGFGGHLINTGKNAYRVSMKILENHPKLASKINPDAMKIAGYMHDIGKISIGDPYHEIESAWLTIMNGEELGLVEGGEHIERREVLRRAALSLPGDYTLFEEMGNNFPLTALYPSYVTEDLIGKTEKLKIDLSATGTPLTIGDLTTPNTLEKAISLYADMTDLNGSGSSVDGRIAEIIERYSKYGAEYKDPEGDYYRKIVELTEQIAPRLKTVTGLIDELMEC